MDAPLWIIDPESLLECGIVKSFLFLPNNYCSSSSFISFLNTWVRKRHRAWANSSQIHILDKGVLRKADSKGCKVKTTKKSINRKTGRAQFQGNEHLRSTQY